METRLTSDQDLASLEPLLSREELSRSRKFFSPDDRRDYVAAHVLARLALAPELDRAPDSIVFGAEPSGRPYVKDMRGSLTEFSLSHTRGFVAVAIARGARIGVDVERTDRMDDPQELYMRVLSPREQTEISLIGAQARRARFVQLWTLKEAYFKVLGTGLSAAPNSVSFDIDGERIARLDVKDETSDWCFRTWFPDDRLCLSICHASACGAVRLHDGRPLLTLPAKAPSQKG
jgi:4'-phosphopantetheinyl transferase